MTDIKEVVYFSPRFKNREELEAAIETNWDATTASQIARCPRNGEYAIRYGLRPREEAIYLAAGNAIHAALAILYAGGDGDLALAELARVWGKGADWTAAHGHKFGHLSLPFLEVVFKNYLDYAKRRDTFQPLTVKMDDLKLQHLLGAVFRTLEDGTIVLGESKIIMEFTVEGKEFVYSGKPDLPITMGGNIYLMDHKSSNGYLSDWWAEQHRFSNQLRGYCAMVSRLTGVTPTGALINGIYMGEKAASVDFKGNRFARFGPMMYQPEHLSEAIRNQYAWRQVLDFYEKQGYYPQHASKLCSNCSFAQLCAVSPAIRQSVMKTEYVQIDRSFLDL
jgi:PD-(D/E)XK nuclease superfamily protein